MAARRTARGAPELSLLPRWCVPLRAGGAFLGTGRGTVAAGRAELVQHWASAATADRLREHADRIRHDVHRVLGEGARCHVGIGSPATALDQLHTAHRQALLAVRAARKLLRLEGIGVWDGLGEYAPLSMPEEVPT